MNKFVLITGKSCSICRYVEKILNTKSEKSNFEILDSNSSDAKELINKYSIMQLPAIINKYSNEVVSGQSCIKFVNNLY